FSALDAQADCLQCVGATVHQHRLDRATGTATLPAHVKVAGKRSGALLSRDGRADTAANTGAALAASCNPGDHPAAATTTSIDDRSGEMRLDAANGKPYTFDAFVDYYGERAFEAWDAATPAAVIASSPLRSSSPPRPLREEPPLPASPNKRTARPARTPTPSSPPKAAALPATVAEVLKMTEAEVLAMEVAPPLPSSWEDDELSADEDLDTGCPRVLATAVLTTHHRRDASADASPPRSPSRKEGTPDATHVHRPVPSKQQQHAARVALEAATQLAEAAARLAQSPLGMAAGSMGAASATAPGAFTSLISALPALVIFLTLLALVAALFGTAPPADAMPPRGTPKAYSLFVPPGCSRHGAPVPAGVGVYNSYTLAVADGASGVQGGVAQQGHAS
ncbi:hypothetical protein Ctob_016742, partial [Chrysochromulina tobinii]